MKVYVPPTSRGRLKARDAIHKHTHDEGVGRREIHARNQRKAARRYAKKQIEEEKDQ